MKKFLLYLLIFSLGACKFRSFVNYYTTSKKTHLPTFNKLDKFLGSLENPYTSCYDIHSYDWQVEVFPEKRKIKAEMKISFDMLKQQDTLLIDLERHLKINSITSSLPLKHFKRKKDIVFIVFERTLLQNEKGELTINYKGTPIHLLKHSTIVWSKDKNNNPWISTVTEGLGPHHLMPCKNKLNDESDSCFIRVTVPKKLFAVANGKLEQIVENKTTKTFHWSVHNPINIYNISFNIGDYVSLEKKYTDINGKERKIDIYPLRYNLEKADTFYNQAPIILSKLEGLFGEFPWWNDGCKIIESCLPHLCMEHQSAISMGDDYPKGFNNFNLTLVHEFAHEWWGNHVTATDYADLWLHEGFADYAEWLFVEQQFGKKDFDFVAYYFARGIKNKRPVAKPYNLNYNTLIHHDDNDIYPKGAWFLHTLRMQLNKDKLFFQTLRKVQEKYGKSHYSSTLLLELFNTETGKDFTPFFQVYLYEISPPVLELKVDETNPETKTVFYRWSKGLPENFKMKITVVIDSTKFELIPSEEFQSFSVPKNQGYIFNRVDFGYILFKEIK